LTPSPGGKQVADGTQGMSTLLIGGKENLRAIRPVGRKNELPAVKLPVPAGEIRVLCYGRHEASSVVGTEEDTEWIARCRRGGKSSSWILSVNTSRVEPLLSGLRLTVPLKKLKKLNCAETLFEFLEQESDSNFSDTSINLKRRKKTKQRFLTDFFKKDS
jgi:hypothetical protein